MRRPVGILGVLAVLLLLCPQAASAADTGLLTVAFGGSPQGVTADGLTVGLTPAEATAIAHPAGGGDPVTIPADSFGTGWAPTFLPLGEWTVEYRWAAASGEVSGWWPGGVTAAAAEPITLADNTASCDGHGACGFQTLTDVLLHEPVAQTGLVQHRSGDPAAGLPVTATSPDRPGDTVTGTTGDSGEFTLPLTPTGTAWTLTVPNGRATAASTVTVTAPPTAHPVIVLADPPSWPVNPHPAATTATSITLSWDVPDDGGAPISGYTAAALGTDRSCTTAGTSCTITGLAPATGYTLTVTAHNRVGDSEPAGTSAATVTPPPPGAPRGAGLAPADRALHVTWTAAPSTPGQISGYTAAASPEGRACHTPPEGTGCTITGLTNGTTYRVTVTAAGPGGSAAADAGSATPGRPPGPVGFLAALPGDRAATISWSAPADTGGLPVSGYTLTASPGGHTCSTAATWCTLTGLDNGTAYLVTVAAANPAGSGPATGPVSVTPTAGPDTSIRLTPAGPFVKPGHRLTVGFTALAADHTTVATARTPARTGRTVRHTPVRRPASGRVRLAAVRPGGSWSVTVRSYAADGRLLATARRQYGPSLTKKSLRHASTSSLFSGQSLHLSSVRASAVGLRLGSRRPVTVTVDADGVRTVLPRAKRRTAVVPTPPLTGRAGSLRVTVSDGRITGLAVLR